MRQQGTAVSGALWGRQSWLPIESLTQASEAKTTGSQSLCLLIYKTGLMVVTVSQDRWEGPGGNNCHIPLQVVRPAPGS